MVDQQKKTSNIAEGDWNAVNLRYSNMWIAMFVVDNALAYYSTWFSFDSRRREKSDVYIVTVPLQSDVNPASDIRA